MEIFLNLSGTELKAVYKDQIICEGCSVYVFTLIWLVFKSLKPIANVIILLDNKPEGLERFLKRHKGLTLVYTVSSSPLKLISGLLTTGE